MFPMFPMFPMMMGFQNKALSQNMKPVRLYRLLQSICNFDTDTYVPTKDLAKVGRLKIFDFDYPLTNKVPRETFEVNILNHFMNRRIGFETPTAFKISLKAKLNEIMPMYNKMFDMLDGWDLFNDGESITKTTVIEYGEKANYDKKNTGTDTMKNSGTDTMKNSGTDTMNNSGTDTMHNTGTDTMNNTGTITDVETGSITNDKRHSNMPQSEISNVQDADYLTTYDYDTQTYNNLQNQNTQNTQNTRTQNTQNQRTLNTQNQRTLNTQNQRTQNTQNERTANLRETNDQSKNIDETITETEKHTEKDKIKIYKEFLENRTSIYTMIYDDLETCFYGLL